jgi:DNA-binding NarL/FixJ family response regulator
VTAVPRDADAAESGTPEGAAGESIAPMKVVIAEDAALFREGLRAAIELRRVADVADFAAALTRVAAGGTALDPEVVSQLLGTSLGIQARGAGGLDSLTGRERQVLSLMAEGRSNAAIAAELVVSPGAVEKHVAGIFAKLGLPPSDNDNRRVLAVLRFLGA